MNALNSSLQVTTELGCNALTNKLLLLHFQQAHLQVNTNKNEAEVLTLFFKLQCEVFGCVHTIVGVVPCDHMPDVSNLLKMSLK